MAVEVYTCPMHPEVQRDQPGICPECGMRLVKSEKVQSEKHAGHSLAIFARKFWVSLALTLPIVLDALNILRLPLYISLLLGSVVFFYGGWVFLQGAVRELQAKLPGMMTLIGLAISAAYIYSVFAVLSGQPEKNLFWELTTLITVMLLGHWLEMRAVQGAQSALKELSKLLPDMAEVVRGEKTEIIKLQELKIGDLVFVRPGGKIPADGEVVDGKSDVNESLVTGESRPVAKNIGSEVIAGTINGDGAMKIKVTKIGEHTFLAGVMRLVAEAQASKSRLQILSDKAAFYLTLIAIFSGTLALIIWLIKGAGAGFALERLVAVLVIACPHALGLAVPLVTSISTTLGARNGLLIRQRLALESARKINIVLFDKTGTLTKGEYGIDKIISNDELLISNNQLLQFAASVDSNSEHFAARAIVKEAQKRGLKLLPVSNFERLPGRGVRGAIDGKEIMVGGEAIWDGEKISAPGKTVIYIVVEGKLAGTILLADVIREESRQAIQDLKDLGVKVAMITGDSQDVARWVAGELGIEEYFARVLPQEKSEKIKLLQLKGKEIAMVGDGINDAPALTQADLGIAIGAGTNVAIESAGIILVKNDPRDIVKIIKLARSTYVKMVQNLFWATGYNIVALPLAAGVLAEQGILLKPALAALFMSLSTVIVAINAVLLRNKKL